jgi:ribosomal protein L11 methyltransferase
VDGIVECLAPERFSPGAADVVLANILAGPLVELAPRLSAGLKPGGSLVLSGILVEQAEEVCNAYANVFGRLRKKVMDGWVLLTGVK